MDVGDHRPRIAQRVRAAGGLVGRAEVLDERLLARPPGVNVALVDAVRLPSPGYPDRGVRQHELAPVPVEREPEDPRSHRVHEHRRRPVEHVSRGDLIPGWPEGSRAGRLPPVARSDREDRPHTAAHVEVRRPVDGVAADHEPAGRFSHRHLDGLGRLLGDQRRTRPALAQGGDHGVVPPHVELVHGVAAGVVTAGRAEPAPERRVRQLALDQHGPPRDRSQHGADGRRQAGSESNPGEPEMIGECRCPVGHQVNPRQAGGAAALRTRRVPDASRWLPAKSNDGPFKKVTGETQKLVGVTGGENYAECARSRGLA